MRQKLPNALHKTLNYIITRSTNELKERLRQSFCSVCLTDELFKMGSFSSKVRTPRDGKEHCKATEVELNASGTSENSVAQPNETSSEDNSGLASRNEEQHLPSKSRQSFSWLVDTPVVLTTGTGNEQKSKGKRCVEVKEKKSSTVLKYANGKYLKSCLHLTEMPPSDPTRPITDTVQSSSSPSSSKHVKYSSCDAKQETSKGPERVNQKSFGNRNVIPSKSGFRVGFGADGTEQICQTSAPVKTRPTAYKGNI